LKNYKSEKVTYDICCKEKLAQIPAVKHPMTQEVIQQIEKKKIEAFQARFAQCSSSRRYQIPGQPLHAKQQKRTEDSLNSPTPAHNKENTSTKSIPSL
jgi:hypothetical protein